MLTPTLQTPSAFLCKLLREQHRAFHAEHPTHVADHLYNFCITALALRDHVFVALAQSEDEQKAFHVLWAREPLREACRDIANAAKHTVLRRAAKTKAISPGTSRVVSVYMDARGNLATHPEEHTTMWVLLSDNVAADIFELTQAVISFWREYFAQHQLHHTEQSDAEFFGISSGAAAT